MHRVRVSVVENALSDPSLISHQDYQRHLTELGCGWVVEDAKEILGFAIGRLTDANIWALFVLPSAEQRGVGRLLHDAMVSHMFSAGLSELWLSTTPKTRAEGFYLRHGWQHSPPHPAAEVRMVLKKADALGI
jgi:GNAT superfamily N-acetyltransferase